MYIFDRIKLQFHKWNKFNDSKRLLERYPEHYRSFSEGCIAIYIFCFAFFSLPVQIHKSYMLLLAEKIKLLLETPSLKDPLIQNYLHGLIVVFSICIIIFLLGTLVYIAFCADLNYQQNWIITLGFGTYFLLGSDIYHCINYVYTKILLWGIQIPNKILAQMALFVLFGIIFYLCSYYYNFIIQRQNKETTFGKTNLCWDFIFSTMILFLFICNCFIIYSDNLDKWFGSLPTLGLLGSFMILFMFNFNRVGVYNYFCLTLESVILSNPFSKQTILSGDQKNSLGVLLCLILSLYITEWLVSIFKRISLKKETFREASIVIQQVFKKNVWFGSLLGIVLYISYYLLKSK
ncbi:hypothetical protein HU830_03005 [Lactobacillus sp. DCY120]|uniref:Uncharacterized protein n=1 Tax=Bombilactobacillus apium TaxID=2675299 RepID=A0A850R1B4_9LACO|nr:hypothetical protein [Bombilactobacillus apium]NVY96150.1 hypothetical protein [Bombilactobacillus apium]